MTWATANRSPIIKRLPGTVTGVGAGATAFVKLPVGVTYTDLELIFTIAGTGATRAQIQTQVTQIRMVLSGTEKWTLTGTQLLAILAFYNSGAVSDDGHVVIPFERLWMLGDSVGAALNPSYGTLGESSFQLEITLAGGATIDAITVNARYNPVAEPLGAHMRIVRLTPTFASTGKFQYNDLPIIPNEYLYALHFNVPVVNNLTDVALVCDDVRIVDVSFDSLAKYYALTTPVRTPQAAALFRHLDFANRGIDSDAIAMGAGPDLMRFLSLELTFANAAPNGFTILAEYASMQPTQGGATKPA